MRYAIALAAMLLGASFAARAEGVNPLRGGLTGPVAMPELGEPAGAAAPHEAFEGRLSLETTHFQFKVVRNDRNAPIDDKVTQLPEFAFDFVSDGNALIPLRRGPITNPHPYWAFELEPGAAWSEPADKGWSRAALPFALMERNENCLHNGVMTFLYRGGEISDVYFQISSETCIYAKFDAWGLAKAHYKPGTPADADAIKTAWRDELAGRLPVKPLSELAAAHPTVSLAGLALAPPTDGDKPTLYGVVLDGVNYTGGCETRAGPYPFCDVLDLPSYSTAKSVVGAIGLMRLEKLWPGARRAQIADYVPECATPDWKGVSFEDVLNMMSGIYDDPGYEKDENSPNVAPFFRGETHAEKIGFACRHYHRKSPPGSVWVYRTTDTYVLGTAMQAFTRKHLGADADLYRDVLAAQLWHRLRLSAAMDSTLRTYDPTAQFFTGFGLTYHRDDVSRLAQFLGPAQGRIAGEPTLDEALLARAMQRETGHNGMAAGYPGFNYQLGFWSRDLKPVLHCARETWTPFMSGFGGISVVMLPNGVVYYYFGDSAMWDWSPAAIEIDKIRPVCP